MPVVPGPRRNCDTICRPWNCARLLLATSRIRGEKGLLYGGGWSLLGKQAVAVLAMAAFSSR